MFVTLMPNKTRGAITLVSYPLPPTVRSLICVADLRATSNFRIINHHTIALNCQPLSHMPSCNAVYQKHCQGGWPQYLGQRRSQ